MEMFVFAIKHDWFILLPILACWLLAVSVAMDRWWFYKRNRWGVDKFMSELQAEVVKGAASASRWADGQKGIVPQVAAETLRLMAERPDKYDSLSEVATSLAVRELHRGLSILGTIATISPYLGLFGTVVRILLTFGELANGNGGGSSASIMFGIGSALIATAAGLLVAIFAVATNNILYSRSGDFEKDFELVKLVVSTAPVPAQHAHAAAPQPRPAVAPQPLRPARAWAEEERQI